jgi:hypothetical protein
MVTACGKQGSETHKPQSMFNRSRVFQMWREGWYHGGLDSDY